MLFTQGPVHSSSPSAAPNVCPLLPTIRQHQQHLLYAPLNQSWSSPGPLRSTPQPRSTAVPTSAPVHCGPHLSTGPCDPHLSPGPLRSTPQPWSPTVHTSALVPHGPHLSPGPLRSTPQHRSMRSTPQPRSPTVHTSALVPHGPAPWRRHLPGKG
ncbi:unnamed protein product [Gadus morhua 'NCC']